MKQNLNSPLAKAGASLSDHGGVHGLFQQTVKAAVDAEMEDARRRFLIGPPYEVALSPLNGQDFVDH